MESFQVEYDWTPDDARALFALEFSRGVAAKITGANARQAKRFNAFSLVGAILGLLAGLAMLWRTDGRAGTGLVIVSAVFLLAVIWAMVTLRPERVRRRAVDAWHARADARDPVYTRWSFAIDESGVRNWCDIMESKWAWRAFERVDAAEEGALFMPRFAHGGMLLAPRRAFASDAELERFVASANGWIVAHAPAPPTAPETTR